MLGFTKKEIAALLKRVNMTESQKNAVVEIIIQNNQRVEQEMQHILDHFLNEIGGKYTKDWYH